MDIEKPRSKIADLLRRKYPRFLLNLPLEYSCPASPIKCLGQAEKGSRGGLKVCLRGHFKIGDNLRIKVFFAVGTELQTAELTTRVVWANFRPEEKENRYGVKIMDTCSEDYAKWGKFLEDLKLR